MGTFFSLITNLVHSVGKSCAVTYEQPIIDADTEDRFQLLLTDGSREPLVQQPRRPCWLQPQLVAEARELHRQRWSDINNAQVSSLFLMNSGPAQVKLLLATARSDTADKAVRRYMQTGLYTLGWALGDVWLPGDPAHASAQRVVGMHESAALLGRDRPVSDIQAPAGPASACSTSSERQRVIAAMRDDMIEYCASNVDGHSGQERAQNEVAGEKPEKSALTHDSNSTPYFCQLSMVMTQWMFVAAVLLHPHQYGLGRVTTQQLTAYVHLWRSIGCRLGVSDRFNLCAGSLSQVHALCWLIERRLMVPALCHVDGGWRCLTDALYDGLSTVLPSTNYESWLVHTLHDVLQLPVPRTRAALGWRSYWLYCVRRTLSEASSRRTGPSVHQTHLLKILRRTCERLQFSNQIMHVFDLL